MIDKVELKGNILQLPITFNVMKLIICTTDSKLDIYTL